MLSLEDERKFFIKFSRKKSNGLMGRQESIMVLILKSQAGFFWEFFSYEWPKYNDLYLFIIRA
jgi:hypothetical protein